jgi:predicted metal-dependent hydrolase
MKTMWGSCNPQTGWIWLNEDLAKKPIEAIEYVVLHEMARFISLRHDEVFLGVLDHHLPKWRQVRTDLNRRPLWAA